MAPRLLALLVLAACESPRPLGMPNAAREQPDAATTTTTAAPTASASTSAERDASTLPPETERLVARLSGSPLWTNGGFVRIDLPETATPAALVPRVFASISFDEGTAKNVKILRSDRVRIGQNPRQYLAVLVDTSLGRKIVLLQFMEGQPGWWNRVYPA